MRWGVITFPGSNDDAQAAYVLETLLGESVVRLWHKTAALDGVDCVVLPGGFSYGDYLRCGAMARFSPIMRGVEELAAGGGLVLGICNGFQILCEAGLLPGALVRNRELSFLCRRVHVRVDDADTAFTNRCRPGDVLELPIKHGEGCYVADADTLRRLEAARQIVLRYCDGEGRVTGDSCPNGSMLGIAGVRNARGNVFGLMPHPEYACEWLVGGEDGRKIFLSMIASGGVARELTAGPLPSSKVVSGP
jgi:phosphoribosylformylglycinamidine synthase